MFNRIEVLILRMCFSFQWTCNKYLQNIQWMVLEESSQKLALWLHGQLPIPVGCLTLHTLPTLTHFPSTSPSPPSDTYSLRAPSPAPRAITTNSSPPAKPGWNSTKHIYSLYSHFERHLVPFRSRPSSWTQRPWCHLQSVAWIKATPD